MSRERRLRACSCAASRAIGVSLPREVCVIYVTEPGHTGGVGAIGMRVLVQSLRDAGHAVKRVRLFKAQEDADVQGTLFGRDTERVVDHTWLTTPWAWFVSVLYVRQYVDLRDMFARMGVPMRTADRSPSDPLIAFGGQFSIAPEPLAEFADVIALGDGELTGGRIAQMLTAGAGREDIMRDLAGVRGFYVPSRGVARFERWESETYRAVTVEEGRKSPTIELARGCASKCAFCRIGWAGGTYREAQREDVERAVRAFSGERLNLFAPDYSSVSWVEDLEALTEETGCRNAGRDARADAAHRHLKHGRGVKAYNFGVEGLSERLRAAIGKPLSRDKLRATMALLSDGEVRTVKWYVIPGLPGETDADLLEFVDTLRETRGVYARRLEVTPTLFAAVPHTPLERAAALFPVDAHARAMKLRETMREWYRDDESLHWSVHQPKGRELHEHDGVLMRSGRESARYIERAKETDIASGRWRDMGVNLDLLAEIPEDAPTAWDHVIAGPPREVRRKALETYWRTLRRGRSLPQIGGHDAAGQ